MNVEGAPWNVPAPFATDNAALDGFAPLRIPIWKKWRIGMAAVHFPSSSNNNYSKLDKIRPFAFESAFLPSVMSLKWLVLFGKGFSAMARREEGEYPSWIPPRRD